MILTIIEVAISLIVVFFLLSTLVSFINELIAMLLNSRGTMLHNSLKELLGNDNILESIYQSNQVKNLATIPKLSGWINKILPWQKNKPEEIGADDFSTALIQNLKNENNVFPIDLAEIKAKINNITGESAIKTKLVEIITVLDNKNKNTIEDFKIEVSNLYNNYMEKVSIIYKNSTKISIFIISIFITITLNVDSIKLFKYFYNQPVARQIMISYAEKNIVDKDTIAKFNFNSDNASLSDSLKLAEFKQKKEALLNDLYSFDLPIGKSCAFKDFSISNFFGLFITIIALTLGAPFWYDLLIKSLNARNKIISNKSKNE